jgi:hypothetical protein
MKGNFMQVLIGAFLVVVGAYAHAAVIPAVEFTAHAARQLLIQVLS